MTTDFRALCAKVLAYNEGQGSYNFSHLNDYDRDNAAFDAWQEIKAELKSALVKPKPERPTVMQLIELSDEIEAAGLGQVDFARAVLARWGNRQGSLDSSPPANSEVAELARLLRLDAEFERSDGVPQLAAHFDRAAYLLQRQYPQPVPVSERLPGPEDCDAEGKCWWGRSESNDWSADWTLATHEAVAEFCEFSPQTVWLPAHALPLPKIND